RRKGAHVDKRAGGVDNRGERVPTAHGSHLAARTADVNDALARVRWRSGRYASVLIADFFEEQQLVPGGSGPTADFALNRLRFLVIDAKRSACCSRVSTPDGSRPVRASRRRSSRVKPTPRLRLGEDNAPGI